MKKESVEWTNKERWRVRKMRRKQAKQLRILARQLGAKTKTEAKKLLKGLKEVNS